MALDSLMCPVCSARFRGVSKCGRCGADLTTLMTLAASAWRMRQAARHALAAGDPARARTLASQAEQICHTPAGRRLHALSAWLINRAATVREPVADESNFAC